MTLPNKHRVMISWLNERITFGFIMDRRRRP